MTEKNKIPYDVYCPIKHTCLIYETIKVIEYFSSDILSSQHDMLVSYCQGCNKICKKISKIVKK